MRSFAVSAYMNNVRELEKKITPGVPLAGKVLLVHEVPSVDVA